MCCSESKLFTSQLTSQSLDRLWGWKRPLKLFLQEDSATGLQRFSQWEATCLIGNRIHSWWMFNWYSWLITHGDNSVILSPRFRTWLKQNTGCKAHWTSLNHLGVKLKTCAKRGVFLLDSRDVLDGTWWNNQGSSPKEITWSQKTLNKLPSGND
jgi:hypothetical protein